MSKQNNFRLSKTKNNILYILSGATLVLFAGLMLFPTINETTHAEGDEPDDGITITVNGEVDANLVLFDEGDYKIAKDTVSVSSSAAYGYELFLTTDSEAHQSIYLNDDPTSESRIAPVSGTIAEPATLTNNTWGFAIAGQGNFDNEYNPANPDPASRFAIIPTADDQQAVFENNAATAEDNIDFYYGIKVEPTLEVGEYTTSAAYTATAKLPPLTAKAILGDNKNLNFVYDRNIYTPDEVYTDNIGETTIINVYEVPMDSTGCTSTTQMPWYEQNSLVESANIDTTFAGARPTGTCGWFSELRNVASITNLQRLNMSNVTNMSYMFRYTGYDATSFNISNLNRWDTSSVTNMSYTFYYTGYSATTWSIGNLNNWNTGKLSNVSYMFAYAGYSATTWNIGSLSGWNTQKFSNMEGMFNHAGYSATTFSLTLTNWNTSNNLPPYTYMRSMFAYAGYSATTWSIGKLTNWKTTTAKSIAYMFAYAGYNATTFNIGDLGKWSLGQITDMSHMFDHAGYSATTWSIGDLSNWKAKTSNVTSMMNMFDHAGYSATTWSIGNLGYVDASHPGWNTSKLVNAPYMFAYAGYSATTWDVGNIGSWNTNKLAAAAYMFNHAGYSATTWDIGNLNDWNTNNVTYMQFMFSYSGYKATTWNIGDISSWNTGKVTNMGGMFSYAGYNATTWDIGNLSGWNTSNVTNMTNTFLNSGYKATTWNIGTISGWNVTKVTSHGAFIRLNINQTNASVVNNQPHWN